MINYDRLGMNVGHFEETWHPDDFPIMEQLLTPFKIVRYMNWQKINGRFDNVITLGGYEPKSVPTLDTRPKPTDDWRYPGVGPYRDFLGVPLELIIDSANRLNARPWVNIPHLATDRLMDEIVGFVIDNAVNRPIIEYSNEVWNTIFQQHYDCGAMGQTLVDVDFLRNEMQMGSVINPADPKSERGARIRGFGLVWQCARTKKLREVVDAHGGGADVVIGSQYAVPWHTKWLMQLCAGAVDAVAIAPYLGMTLKHGGQLSSLIDEVSLPESDRRYANTAAGRLRKHQEFAGTLPVWGYESGLHLHSKHPIEAFLAFNRDVTAGKVTRHLLETWFANGGDWICLYSLTAPFEGSTQYFGHVELTERTTGGATGYEVRPKFAHLFT